MRTIPYLFVLNASMACRAISHAAGSPRIVIPRITTPSSITLSGCTWTCTPFPVALLSCASDACRETFP